MAPTGAQLSGSGAQLSGSGAQLSGSGAQLSAILAYLHTSYLGAQLSASHFGTYTFSNVLSVVFHSNPGVWRCLGGKTGLSKYLVLTYCYPH